MRFACVHVEGVGASGPSEEQVLQIGESLSPRFEWSEGRLYLDLGQKSDDEECHRRIAARFAEDRLPCTVGIASTKRIAQLAVAAGRRIVAREEEKPFLDALPIALLNPSPKIAEKLARWGIRHAGALARLPSAKIGSLLGLEGWTLQQAARGVDLTPFSPYVRPPRFSKTLHLEWPILELTAFIFAVQSLLERLLHELLRLDAACGLLQLHLGLDPKGAEDRSIRLRNPTRDLKTLLELLSREMRRDPPKAPISEIQIDLHPDRARGMQLSLFGPPAFSPVRLAATLAHLCALIGPDRIGRPVARDGLRPERWQRAAYDPPPPPLIRDAAPFPGQRGAVIRVLRPSLLLAVVCEEAWPHRPGHVRSLSSPERLDSRVRVASGPWKMEEGWWTNDPVRREYWTVELANGWILRIFRDDQGGWHADGLYD